MKPRSPIIFTLMVLGCALTGSIFFQPSASPDPLVSRINERSLAIGTGDISILGDFEKWVSSVASGLVAMDSFSVEKGVRLARARASIMRTLILEDPEKALSHAVSFSAYAKLPSEVRVYVERPFSTQGEFLALPICGGDGGTFHDLVIEGKNFTASVYGNRASIGTKEDTPLQGITLGEHAAIREGIFQPISEEDANEFPVTHLRGNRCFSTGVELGENAVTTLAGGKKFRFANAEVLRVFDARAAELDEVPGPHSGSRTILLMADGGNSANADDGSFDWEAVESEVEFQASAWTENPKSIFYIRVDFSDNTGESTTEATLSNVVNTTVTQAIQEYSYGKTEINATVSSAVVRMPSPTTTYTPSENEQLRSDAIAAAEAQIPSFNAGDYDIIGVHFKSIGMRGRNSTFNYGGLAGGSRQWIQGNTSGNLIIHEFGHNYGIGHASFWETTDGSVVGAGENIEYGDRTDVMGDGPNGGHFGPQAKVRLDWFSSAQWTDVTASGSGTYRVYRFDDPATSAAATTRGLRITKNASPSEYYWVGHRANLPENRWLQDGAYLTWERPNQNRTWLLDTTPGTTDGRDDAAITLGRTYSDLTAGVHITTVDAGGSAPDEWVDVAINIGSFPGNQSPQISLTGPSTANARDSVFFSVSATDVDGDSLAYHWDIGDGSIARNVASQSLSWAVGGTYTVNVTVSDLKGGTASASKVVTVTDPLNSWAQSTSGTTSSLEDVATDGTTIVAVGGGSGTYRSSTDGITWIGGTTGINRTLYGITHTGEVFLAAGQNYDFSINAWKGVIYSSPDGSSWTERHYAGQELRDIATNGSVHIAVGYEGEIWRSTNGTSWSPITSGTSVDLKGVSYGNGTFVAIGSGSPGNSGGPVVVLTSSDSGLNWTDTSSGAGTASWQGFYDVEFCNDRFFASGFYSKLRVSTDAGASFSAGNVGTQQIPAFAYGNGVYFAAGIDRDDDNADINLISTDGDFFSALSTANYATRNGATFFGGRFYTVGDGGEIWRSSEILEPSLVDSAAIWLASYFPEIPGADFTTDDDGDGISNLQEYATGSDPTEAGDFVRVVKSESDGYLTLTLERDPTAVGVLTEVELSTNMNDWDTSGTVVLINEPSMLQVRSAELANSPAGKRQFMRATFTLPE